MRSTSPWSEVTARGTPLGATTPTAGPVCSVVLVVPPDVVEVGLEIVVSTEEVEVWLSVAAEAHADAMSAKDNVKVRRMCQDLGTIPELATRWESGPYWRVMFGPLNGVRTALVIGAGLAALVALVTGRIGAAVVLLLGIAIHGAGWLYLYGESERNSQAERAGE